jgi:hypothetical protein
VQVYPEVSKGTLRLHIIIEQQPTPVSSKANFIYYAPPRRGRTLSSKIYYPCFFKSYERKNNSLNIFPPGRGELREISAIVNGWVDAQ